MGSGDNDAFMEDFGDSLNDEADPWQIKTGRNTAEALDTSLQAPNANDYSNARLIEEVRRMKGLSVHFKLYEVKPYEVNPGLVPAKSLICSTCVDYARKENRSEW